MKLFIPSIGDKLELIQKWEFPVYLEYRNYPLLSRLRPGINYSYCDEGSIMASLPKGTILRVDRIYIRKGKSDWDSVTFAIVSAPDDNKRLKLTTESDTRHTTLHIPEANKKLERKLKGSRFWAKLDNVNEINCKIINE